MDKETLKKMYKPICIHVFNDEYFDSLLNVIESICNEKSIVWLINCIKGFVLEEFEYDFKIELAKYLEAILEDESITAEIIAQNNAELAIFSQAIVYEGIMNNSIKEDALILSLALNTLSFGNEESLNHHYLSLMKKYYREKSIENINRVRIDEEKNELIDSLTRENIVLKWMINLNRDRYRELNDSQFAFKVGKELAEKSGTQQIFRYPEAYIAKIMLSSNILEDSLDAKRDLKEVLKSIKPVEEFFDEDESLYPVLTQTTNKQVKISLIDFAIEVYYENVLFNHLKSESYVG